MASNWTEYGSELSNRVVINQRRGRIGLCLVICGFVFMMFGSYSIVSKPSLGEEREILEQRKRLRRLERLEMSMNDTDAADLFEEEKF